MSTNQSDKVTSLSSSRPKKLAKDCFRRWLGVERVKEKSHVQHALLTGKDY